MMLPPWKQRYPAAFWSVLFGCLVVHRCAAAFNNDDTANVVETPKRKSNQDSSSSLFVEYANQECSVPLSETDCRSYAASKNLQFVRLSSNNNATNNNSNSQRPGGCFVDTTTDKFRVFYNARNDTDNSNITSTSNTADSTGYYCNLSYRSVCHDQQPPPTCYGYFCDQTLDTMFLFMTHNSYAVRGKITIYNQNYDESKQFRAGIRGFNFDIYDENDGDDDTTELLVDHTPNSQTWNPQLYRDSVNNVLRELDKCENRYEIVVVELEMKKSGKLTNQWALEPWGDKVIRNYNPGLPFSHYIQKGQRVLITTNKAREGNPNIGMHVRSELFVQNGYDWKCATNQEPDFNYREGPLYQDKAARLMNHFCYNALGLPDTGDSKRVNDLKVLQTNAETFSNKFGGWPNVILVDFYEQGNIWPAQELFRSGNKDMILLEDGQVCDTATTCEYCINNHSYWYSKAATACGTEPCWEDGRTCGKRSCEAMCCSGSFEYWMSLRSIACGKEPKFEENCREPGDFCYKNYSCDECCSNDIECPWYGFTLGCFCV